MPRLIAGVLCAAILIGSGTGPASGQEPRLLDAEAWRADLNQLTRAIRTTHPRPFHRVEEADLDATVERLAGAIPDLSDHAIMFHMSQIVGMLQDGHTRLSLPRTHPGFAFTYSHSVDPEPSDPGLRLSQLPVNLAALSDGLFVDEAAEGYEQYLGYRVVGFEGLSASDGLATAGTFVSADNAGARRLLAADLLESPDVLSHLGAVLRECGVPVRLEDPSGSAVSVCWRALSGDGAVNVSEERPIYRIRRAEGGGPVVLELNEIANTRERSIGEIVAAAVREAEVADGRLVIDLRRNTGGSNSYGRAVILAVAQSAELNSYGRTFALIGPRTFSAAQYLLNQLERYTRVLFVGEPSGSHPDHYGDSRRVRLNNSGLTLRVSTLHWSSGTGNDQRDATRPHVLVRRTSGNVFGAGDPALEAAARYRFAGLADLMISQLRGGSPYNAAHIGYYDVVSPGEPELSVRGYLRMGRRLAGEGELLAAARAYQIGLLSYPGDPRLRAVFEEARARLKR